MKNLSSAGFGRMLDTDATSFERELLQAGALERPTPELLLAMQRGLGIAPDVAPQAEPSPLEPSPLEPPPRGLDAPLPAAGEAVAWSSATLIKAGLGAAIGAGVVIAALSLPTRHTEPVPASTSGEVRAAPAEVPAPPTASAAHDVPVDAPDPARELRLEIELLDRVRAALSASEPERAQSLLDEYAARFPEGTLAREAQVLRSKVARGAAGSRTKLPTGSD